MCHIVFSCAQSCVPYVGAPCAIFYKRVSNPRVARIWSADQKPVERWIVLGWTVLVCVCALDRMPVVLFTTSPGLSGSACLQVFCV